MTNLIFGADPKEVLEALGMFGPRQKVRGALSPQFLHAAPSPLACRHSDERT
jgi:hypothetical protein